MKCQGPGRTAMVDGRWAMWTSDVDVSGEELLGQWQGGPAIGAQGCGRAGYLLFSVRGAPKRVSGRMKRLGPPHRSLRREEHPSPPPAHLVHAPSLAGRHIHIHILILHITLYEHPHLRVSKLTYARLRSPQVVLYSARPPLGFSIFILPSSPGLIVFTRSQVQHRHPYLLSTLTSHHV